MADLAVEAIVGAGLGRYVAVVDETTQDFSDLEGEMVDAAFWRRVRQRK